MNQTSVRLSNRNEYEQMCMLCVVPPNVIPSREKLENSALNNPHGFGFAIVIPSERRIHAERTMNADTSINRFLKMRALHPEGYAMWHARFATHGSTTVENCHPFRVGGDRQTYLAHNGMLPVIEPQGDTRSDTRIFAEDLLPAIGGVASLDNEQIVNLLEDFTTGSKVAVLTVDPSAKYQCYIIHKEKGWEDDSGVWWSNDSCFLPKPYSYTATTWDTKYGNTKYYSSRPLDLVSEVKFYECSVCELSVAEDELWEMNLGDDYCPQCGSCYDCKTYMSDCMCYKGKDADAKWWAKQGGWNW